MAFLENSDFAPISDVIAECSWFNSKIHAFFYYPTGLVYIGYIKLYPTFIQLYISSTTTLLCNSPGICKQPKTAYNADHNKLAWKRRGHLYKIPWTCIISCESCSKRSSSPTSSDNTTWSPRTAVSENTLIRLNAFIPDTKKHKRYGAPSDDPFRQLNYLTNVNFTFRIDSNSEDNTTATGRISSLCFLSFIRKLIAPASCATLHGELNSTEIDSEDTLQIDAAAKYFTASSDLTRKSSKPFLILLNPFSGSGRATHLFSTTAQKIFDEANLSYHIVKTTRRGFAADFCRNEKSESFFNRYSAIICVSGDGLIHEVLNGLFQRPLQNGMDSPLDYFKILPIGVLPTGSGNGIASSIAYHSRLFPSKNLLMNSSLLLTRPFQHEFDLFCIETYAEKSPQSESMTSTHHSQKIAFLSLTWGLLADVDLDSEIYRRCGSSRFAATLFHKLIAFRRFRAKIYYLQPVKEADQIIEYNCFCTKDPFNRFTRNLDYNQSISGSNKMISDLNHLDNNDDETLTIWNLNDSKDLNRHQWRYLPNIEDDIQSGRIDIHQGNYYEWKCIEDDFLSLAVVNVSHISDKGFISSKSKFNDGLLYLNILTSQTKRLDIFKVMNDLENGGSFDYQFCKIIPCKAFRLVTEEAKQMAIDGERLEPTKIVQGEILHSVANFLTGPYVSKTIFNRT